MTNGKSFSTVAFAPDAASVAFAFVSFVLVSLSILSILLLTWSG